MVWESTSGEPQLRMSSLEMPEPKLPCAAVAYEGIGQNPSSPDFFDEVTRKHCKNQSAAELQWLNSKMNSQFIDCGAMDINCLGLPYNRIAGGAYPPYISSQEVERLRKEWTARGDDVFLVFPAEPVSSDFEAFSVALVEQLEVASVDAGFPRWLEAAVSCRGWEYVDAIDASPVGVAQPIVRRYKGFRDPVPGRQRVLQVLVLE
jgi:hypothetical protein